MCLEGYYDYSAILYLSTKGTDFEGGGRTLETQLFEPVCIRPSPPLVGVQDNWHSTILIGTSWWSLVWDGA